MRLLLVEDEKELAAALSAALEKHGIVTDHTMRLDEAVERAKRVLGITRILEFDKGKAWRGTGNPDVVDAAVLDELVFQVTIVEGDAQLGTAHVQLSNAHGAVRCERGDRGKREESQAVSQSVQLCLVCVVGGLKRQEKTKQKQRQPTAGF